MFSAGCVQASSIELVRRFVYSSVVLLFACCVAYVIDIESYAGPISIIPASTNAGGRTLTGVASSIVHRLNIATVAVVQCRAVVLRTLLQFGPRMFALCGDIKSV